MGDYNALALAKYHVANAAKYKNYGAELYKLAKADAAQSVALKNTAMQNAAEAKNMFENAGLNRLGLEESASKLHSDETQAKALHSTTKQKLLLAQRNFKLGTKN